MSKIENVTRIEESSPWWGYYHVQYVKDGLPCVLNLDVAVQDIFNRREELSLAEESLQGARQEIVEIRSNLVARFRHELSVAESLLAEIENALG